MFTNSIKCGKNVPKNSQLDGVFKIMKINSFINLNNGKEKNMKKISKMDRIKHVVICFLLLVMSSISIKAAPTNAELKVGLNQEYETLNPLLATTAAAKYMIYFAHRPVAYLAADKQFKPLIVKKIPNLKDKSLKIVNEGSSKKLVSEWEFVDNLKWSDGVPVTCADWKFSWQVGLNPNVSLPSKEAYENIESIEWSDKTPTKCTIKYKKALWNFFLDMPEILPRHIEEEIYNKYSKEPQGYDRNTMYQKDTTKKGLWYGPYVISEAKIGSHIILTPNEFYYGKQKPAIKKIVLKFIVNTGTLEANLRSGNVDMISHLGLSLDQALAFEKKLAEEKLPFNIKFEEGVTYAHIDLNLDHPILKELKVRQALFYGLNREEIVKTVYEGKASVAHHLTAPIDRIYTEDKKIVRIYESDKKMAKKLLDEAGWKLSADGYRYKNGKKLSLNLTAAGGIKVNETLQSIMQSQWKSIGVDIQIKNETGRFLFSETLPKRKFEMAFFSWSSFPEQSPMSVLHSANIPTAKNTWTGQNFPGFKNSRADHLCEDYEREFDANKRLKIMRDILKIYTEELPVLPVYYRSVNAVVPKNLKNFRLVGHLFYDSLQAEEWSL